MLLTNPEGFRRPGPKCRQIDDDPTADLSHIPQRVGHRACVDNISRDQEDLESE
jgi:hypothetical protein